MDIRKMGHCNGPYNNQETIHDIGKDYRSFKPEKEREQENAYYPGYQRNNVLFILNERMSP
jgi:hypothetical protein